MLFFALVVPLLMAIWFAPALVMLHDFKPVDALRVELPGCLRNIPAFLIYGVVGLVLAIVATIPLCWDGWCSGRLPGVRLHGIPGHIHRAGCVSSLSPTMLDTAREVPTPEGIELSLRLADPCRGPWPGCSISSFVWPS